MTLAPQIEGNVAVQSSAAQFVEAFRQRVERGLFPSRSNYLVADAGPTQLRFCAADWWTAINVGLNEVELWLPEPGAVHYRVRYWRWAG